MITIDSNFNRIDNNYDDIYNNIINSIKENIKDDKILYDIMDNNDHIIIQETNGDNFTIKTPTGANKSIRFPSSAAALKSNMVIGVNDEFLGIRPGVALRPNFTVHQLTHELLHAISSTQINRFDSDGVTFVKIGTKVNYYDKQLNDFNKDNNPSSDLLNEGVTEYLTSVITNEYTGQYPSMVVVAKLLTYSNDNLLNAYFSRDLKELESFYEDLEEKQSIITRDDLINFDMDSFNQDRVARIIAGAINYNKSLGNEVDENTLNWVVSYLDNYDMLDAGSWSDVITSYLEENSKTK